VDLLEGDVESKPVWVATGTIFKLEGTRHEGTV